MFRVDRLELAEDFFPLPQPAPVKCGLRSDLPKKQRRHHWAYLGMDTRTAGEKGFKDYAIFACYVCGTDRKEDRSAVEFM